MNEEIIQEKLRSLQEDLLAKFDELKSDNQKFKLRLQKIEEKLGLEDKADKIDDEVIEEVACEERDEENPDLGTKGEEEVPEHQGEGLIIQEEARAKSRRCESDNTQGAGDEERGGDSSG